MLWMGIWVHPYNQTLLSKELRTQFLGQFIMEIGSNSGFCLWASVKHTLLSELCMQFQVNSLRGSVHGNRDFRLWAPGDQTLLGIELCMQFLGQFITGIGSRVSVLASGRPGSKHCTALKCTHGPDSTAYAVSGQPSAAYFWSLFLGLDQVRTARPSRGSQIAIRHPGEHTILGYSTVHAVGSCRLFNSGLDQVRTARPSRGLQIATRHLV